MSDAVAPILTSAMRIGQRRSARPEREADSEAAMLLEDGAEPVVPAASVPTSPLPAPSRTAAETLFAASQLAARNRRLLRPARPAVPASMTPPPVHRDRLV